MKLRQALQSCSSSQLTRIVAAWSLPVEAGTLRRELVELIAEHLTRAAAEDLWNRLPSSAGDVVQALARAGGRHDADLLIRRMTSGPNGEARNTAQASIQAGVTFLIERGVIYRIFEAAEQRQGVYLSLPDELAASLPLPTAPSDERRPTATVVPPTTTVACDPAADLFVLASALRREAWGGPSRGLARRPPRSVAQILARLRTMSLPGPGQPGQRWRFLLWLAQRAGWIDRASPPLPDDDAVLRLLREPAALPGRALAAGPAQTPSGAAASGAGVAVRPGRLQADALQLLSELPDDRWWHAEDLAGWVAAQLIDGADPQRASRQLTQLQRTVERWLGGRWFWLGLFAWGQTELGWIAVRPTAALRRIVSGREASSATVERMACAVGPDVTLLAPPNADLAALYRAEPSLTYTGSVDGLRRYRLSPPSVERGMRRGGSADDLKSQLAHLLGQSIPSEWSSNIDRWSDSNQQLRLDASLILSATDSTALTEALAVRGAREAVAERLSPTHVRIAGERLATLLAELAAAGLPVQIDPGLRAEPAHVGRAGALAGSAAEAAWIGLEIARRLAPEIVDGQRDLMAARQQLEAIFSQSRLEALERRVASIMATAADRKRPKQRRRVV